LSLEEINGKFGDEVIVRLTDAKEKQVESIEGNEEEKYSVPTHKELDSCTTPSTPHSLV
jgi:hypothetical protein